MEDTNTHGGGSSADDAPAPAESTRRKIAFELPEGSLGVLLLLIVAAVSGGLIAAYWPVFFGSGDLGTTQDRLTALETRVGQIASGRAGAAATGVFDDLRHSLGALGQRLDADEARLDALEKSSGETGVPAPADLAPLRQKMDAISTSLGDITGRLGKLESAHVAASDLAPITAKLGALDSRVGALEADIARSAQTFSGTVSGLETRLKALEANQPPPDLAQRLDSFALKTDQQSIDARLQTLEAANTGESLHRAAAVLALARLAQASAEAGPFALELDTYAVTAPSDPVIAQLQPYAARGVPTQAMLAARFPQLAHASLDAERSGDARTFFARLWANIMSLVSVRRVGDVAGNDTESRLARAQVKLDARDFAGAIAEVRALHGVAARTVAPWLKDAEARMQVDHAVAEISARVIQALAAPPKPANPAPAPAEAPALSPVQGGKQ
jgi:hypothetical protein